MSYVELKKQDIDGFLKAEKGWICNKSGNEHIYDFHLKKYPIIVKVASSIRVDTGRAKNKGSDAIRIYAVEKASTKIDAKITRGLVKSSRVNRTTNWRVNLEKQVLNMIGKSKIIYDRRR